MVVMSLVTTILVVVFWLLATGKAAIITFAILFGIGSGAGIGLTPALCAHIAPVKDMGTFTGIVFAFASIAALTRPPIGGQLISLNNGSFRYTAIFAGVSCALGTVLFLLCRIVLRGVRMARI